MREKDGGKPITGQQKHWMVGLPAPDAHPRRRPEARESPVDCKISIGRAHTEPRLTGHCPSRHLSPSLSLVVLFPCSTQTIYQHISNKYITILCNENFVD